MLHFPRGNSLSAQQAAGSRVHAVKKLFYFVFPRSSQHILPFFGHTGKSYFCRLGRVISDHQTVSPLISLSANQSITLLYQSAIGFSDFFFESFSLKYSGNM